VLSRNYPGEADKSGDTLNTVAVIKRGTAMLMGCDQARNCDGVTRECTCKRRVTNVIVLVREMIKVTLCLTKYHAMRMYPVLN